MGKKDAAGKKAQQGRDAHGAGPDSAESLTAAFRMVSGKKDAPDNITVNLKTLASLVETFMAAARRGDSQGAPEAGEDYAEEEDFLPEPVNDTGIRFRNVGGARDLKTELQRVVRFLRDPGRYRSLGAELPRGILLKGPPGSGKTMLAKALAGEARVPFINVSGTDFDADSGPARLRLLIDAARESVEEQRERGRARPACIIHIEDIDVFGAVRKGADDSPHQAVLMELARLMDDLDPADNIIVVASTNRPDILDPALIRPGRFDLDLDVPAPTLRAREDILKVIIRDRGIALKADVDLKAIARQAYSFDGADLNQLVNEAAMLAGDKGNARKVGAKEFDQAYWRLVKGPRIHLDRRLKDRESVALHEAGHAIAGLRKEADGMSLLRNVTILAHTGSLGTTYFDDNDCNSSRTRKKIFADLVVDYAGRVAEELAYGKDNISDGAGGDIENATETAWEMVAHYGFNEKLGLLQYGADGETLGDIYKEMRELTAKAYEEAKTILTQDFRALVALAQALVEHETLTREDVIAVTGIEPGKPKQVSLKKLAASATPPGLQK